MKYLKKLSKILWSNTNYRRGLLLIADIYLIMISVDIALWFQEKEAFSINNIFLKKEFTFFLILVSILTNLFTGQYKGVTRFLSSIYLYFIFLRNVFSIFLTCFFGILFY